MTENVRPSEMQLNFSHCSVYLTPGVRFLLDLGYLTHGIRFLLGLGRLTQRQVLVGCWVPCDVTDLGCPPRGVRFLLDLGYLMRGVRFLLDLGFSCKGRFLLDLGCLTQYVACGIRSLSDVGYLA